MQNENFLSGFGYRLRHERVRLNLTQEEISEKCGISRVQWGKYEREVSSPSKKVLQKLEQLGANIEYILFAKANVQNENFDDLKSYPFSNNYINLKGHERRLYQMAYASDWVDEAERQNFPVKFHPALKQMLAAAVSSGGLSQAGIFNLIDGLALFAQNNEPIFIHAGSADTP